MFNCVLCLDEKCYLTNMCEECTQIRRIISIYGRSEILDILKRICIREKDKRENKIKFELGDDSYIKEVNWKKKENNKT